MKQVLVFKTSVETQEDEKRIKPVLDSFLHGKARWNFDLEDWENILRIENHTLAANTVIKTLNAIGYECEELAD